MKTLALIIFAQLIVISSFGQYQFTNYGSQKNTKSIIADGNYLWIGTHGGIEVRHMNGTVMASYTTENGLPEPQILDIAIDVNGIKWICINWYGVVRFDGTTWTDYKDLDGKADGIIKDAEIDAKGVVWFIGNGYLVSYDGNEFVRHNSPASSSTEKNFWYLTIDQEGNKWIGTNGGGVYKYNGITWTHYTTSDGLLDDYIYSMYTDYDGNVWIGTKSGANKFDGISFSDYTSSGLLSGVYGITQDISGEFYFGTDQGVTDFDGVSTYVQYTTGDGLVDNKCRQVAVDAYGSLWVLNGQYGMSRFDGVNWRTFASKGLTTNTIYDLEVDKYDNIWFKGDGLVKYDGINWSNITMDDGLLSNIITEIKADTLGEIWVGHNNGISHYTGSACITYTTADGLPSNSIRAIAVDDKTNAIWAATADGLARLDGSSWTSWDETDGLIGADVQEVVIDSGGNAWCCTQNGLSVFDGSTFTSYTIADGLPINWVSDVAFDANGKAWIATWGEEVVSFDGEKWVVYDETDGISWPFIYDIKIDKTGTIWVATQHGGIMKFDNDIWMNYTEEEGLPSNSLYEIAVDSKNNKWVGTLAGASKISCEAPEVDFSYVTACLPDTSNFLNLSTKVDTFTSYLWSFEKEKESISSQKQLSYLFSSTGSYSLILEASNELCSSSKKYIVNVSEKPVAKLIPDQDIVLCKNEIENLAVNISNKNEKDVYSITWNTGIENETLSVDAQGYYFAMVEDVKGQCFGYTDTITINVVEPYATPQICLVTVDEETGKNKIIWERTANQGIESYNIYKVYGKNYLPVGNVPIEDISIYIDYSSTPEAVAARYGISVVDTCGNESDISPFHQTMYLGVSVGAEENTYVLDWTDYIDESGGFEPEYYYIYRGETANNLVLHDSTSGFTTNWNDVEPGNAKYYRVAVEKPTLCSPANFKANNGPFSRSISNLEDNRIQSTNINTSGSHDLKVFPNPLINSTIVRFNNSLDEFKTLKLYNTLGEVVYMQENISGNSVEIQKGNLASGIYIVEVLGSDRQTTKLIVK